MRQDLQLVADALGVPGRWLGRLVACGFAMFLLADATGSSVAGWLAVIAGLAIIVIGVRGRDASESSLRR
jgi:hypothetical protein